MWIVATVFAGICLGIFGLPMKLTKNWKWEHTWAMYAFWALLVMPWIIGIISVPDIIAVYSKTPIKTICIVSLLGLIWGIANITFGLGLNALGISLGYSLMLGLIICFGSLFPMLTGSHEALFTAQNMTVIVGLAVMVVSLALNVSGALRKDRELHQNNAQLSSSTSVTKGLVFCFLTGLFAVGLNYAFIFGEPIRNLAAKMGASAALASNAILPVALTGAAILTMCYCGSMIHKNRTWGLYVQTRNYRYYLYTAFMSIWTVGMAVFGIAAANMGKLGHSIGWAILNASAIIFANLVGILSGELKGTSLKTRVILVIGIVTMILGICVVGWANSF